MELSLARRPRARARWSRLLTATLPLAIAAYAGCSASAPAPPEAPPSIGPAPLRRLSNSEYLNALHDLFPDQQPALPRLPDDTLVSGFENAAEAQKPSDVRIARYEAIASLYAEGATATPAGVRALVGCADWSTPSQATTCATQFVERTGSRIFRRPLSAAERDRFTLKFQSWSASIDFEAAVRLTLSAMLQSPQFLYRAEPTPAGSASGTVVAVEPYAMASRLSFFLWESVPDDELLAAAGRDELRTTPQIKAHAERLLRDDRARRVYWSFHRQWLGLDRILEAEHAVRTPEVDPGWSAASQGDARTESRLFVENVLMGDGSFRDLLTSPRAWVNGEMARVYGLPSPTDPAAWSETSLPAAQRGGLLTRAAFLAGLSHRGGTSPPLRGNGVQLRLLCRLPQSPPPDADLTPPVADPSQGPQTNRMLFEARTKPAACQGCHVGLNGFGFGFENYSAAAAYQTLDHGLPVDARGAIHGTDVNRSYNGALELSDALSQSRIVRHCTTQQWVRYALGRAPIDLEAPMVETLTDRFMDSGSVRALLMDIVTAPSFRMRRVEDR